MMAVEVVTGGPFCALDRLPAVALESIRSIGLVAGLDRATCGLLFNQLGWGADKGWSMALQHRARTGQSASTCQVQTSVSRALAQTASMKARRAGAICRCAG